MPGTDTSSVGGRVVSESYDYTQDPQFLQAPPEQQHAYLQHVDPEYAGAHPDQQKAYLGHINGGQYSEKGALSNPPVAPPPGDLQKAGRVQKATAPSELTGTSASPSEDAGTAGTTATGLGLVADPVATVGSVVGGAAGAYGGGKVGRYVGGDTGETVGKVVGGIGGGIMGGAGAHSIDFPDETTIGGVKFKNPFKKAEFPSTGGGAPEPNRGEFEQNQEKNLVGEGKFAKLPTRMPPKPKAPAPVDEVAQAVKNRTANWIPNKVTPPLEQELPIQNRAHAEMNQDILNGRQERASAKDAMDQDILSGRQERAAGRDTAHNDLAEARMRRGAAQEKIDAGIPTQGSDQKVAVLPEPHEPLPGDKPGSQWSVKRRTDLVQNAKRGQPGATDVIKNQRPVVLEPRGGTGYGGPRQWDPNNPPEPPEAGPTVSGSKPIVPPKQGPNLVGEGPVRLSGEGPENRPVNGRAATDEMTIPHTQQELAEIQARHPERLVTHDNVNDILRDEARQADVSEKLKGNRTDRTGAIREEHRAKLEKKGER